MVALQPDTFLQPPNFLNVRFVPFRKVTPSCPDVHPHQPTGTPWWLVFRLRRLKCGGRDVRVRLLVDPLQIDFDNVKGTHQTGL